MEDWGVATGLATSGDAAAGPAELSRASGARTDERIIELWLHGKGENTKKAYLNDLSRFLEFQEGKPLRTVTLADLQDFSDFLCEVLRAPASRARTLACIKSLFSFGYRVGYLPFDVGRAVRLPALRDERAERILAESEVHSMIALTTNKRDRVLLKILYVGGLRVAEALSLRTRDLKQREEGGQVSLFGKGDKSRAVLLPEGVFSELWSLADHGDPDAPLFRSRKSGEDGTSRAITARQAERMVKAAAERAGIKERVSPHWMRHAHASHALERGAKLHLVKATLGHASVATTGRYLHARPDESSAMFLAT